MFFIWWLICTMPYFPFFLIQKYENTNGLRRPFSLFLGEKNHDKLDKNTTHKMCRVFAIDLSCPRIIRIVISFLFLHIRNANTYFRDVNDCIDIRIRLHNRILKMLQREKCEKVKTLHYVNQPP